MNLPNTFETYLLSQGASRITTKNYLSDLNHFLGWLELILKSQNLPFSANDSEFLTRYFNPQIVEKYKLFLLSNHLPTSTINRRFSTLRNLAKFCLSQGWVRENPCKNLTQIKLTTAIPDPKRQILELFKKHLEHEGNTSNTIKNYLSDIGGFLRWLEINLTT